ncbi:MAG TPA: hypothetical protein VHL58_15845 [Thermoanaerobaculia bacterium]|nr:hypothetical protein [Thermoanaerobaculia bacterium]
MDFELLPPFQRRVMATATELARAEQREVYLVGGAVRDLLLGKTTRDIDFTLPAGTAGFAAGLARSLGGEVVSFPAFRTHKIEPPGEAPIDVTEVRSETYEFPGALPTVTHGTLRQDMERRDFSINAIAYRLHDRAMIDLLGGIDDLRAGVLRALHDRSFLDDPTRMLRGVRLASRLSLSFDTQTRTLLDVAVRQGALTTISPHRLWREVLLAFEEERPVAALRAMSAAGLVPFDVQPEDRRDREVEALATATPGERDLIVAGHLVASPERVAETFRGCEWSERRKRELQRIVESRETASRELPQRSSAAAQFQFLQRLPLILVRIMSVTDAEHGEVFRRYLRAAKTPISFRHPDRSLLPGPHMGLALNEARQALFEGSITPEEAQSFASAAAIRYFSEREGA